MVLQFSLEGHTRAIKVGLMALSIRPYTATSKLLIMSPSLKSQLDALLKLELSHPNFSPFGSIIRLLNVYLEVSSLFWGAPSQPKG